MSRPLPLLNGTGDRSAPILTPPPAPAAALAPASLASAGSPKMLAGDEFGLKEFYSHRQVAKPILLRRQKHFPIFGVNDAIP